MIPGFTVAVFLCSPPPLQAMSFGPVPAVVDVRAALVFDP
jgi:hypothetical protein